MILNGTPAVITTCSVSSASPSANAARTALTTASLKRVLLPDRTQFVPQVKARRLAVPISDDKAMIGGLGKIGDQSFMFIGQQKGFNTKTRQYRNFGMANPEGYRKALRLMKSAEKFGIPVVSLIDTPGAYPGLEAEERGQGEAIARNILEMTRLKVPIIVAIIGEGASGGALGIGVGDKVLMLENTWYSVISPESCSSILWRSWEYKEQAAEALKLTAKDMKRMKLVDQIVKEPLGGAHKDPQKTYLAIENAILKSFDELKVLSQNELVEQRMDKYAQMGVYKD